MNLNDFDFNLPENLIASYPLDKRDESKLLICKKNTSLYEIKKFGNIIDELDENCHLVFNDAKVLKARLFGKKATGGKVEIFLNRLIDINQNKWEVIGKNIRNAKVIYFDDNLEGIIEQTENELFIEFNLKFNEFDNWLKQFGHIPLPPYILKARESHSDEEIDNERYQTVYAKELGAVAAPTAGLHFTDELINKLKKKNITMSFLTLYVGLGTFLPIKGDDILTHHMHIENYVITQKSADEINEAQSQGKKIIAVGTTSVRTLEANLLKFDKVTQEVGSTNLFIYPGFNYKIIDGLITNFHLPKSTLLLLVSALHGKENILFDYTIAVENNFRFFSYGDAMFIKP